MIDRLRKSGVCRFFSIYLSFEGVQMVKNYENLALQGGGVWGISYAGAFEELDRLGVLGQINCVAGTSAGSLAGLLLALRYTGKEISRIIQGVDYTKFLDQGKLHQIVRNYGFYTGDYASELFHGWLQERLGSELATFADLRAAGGLDLRVYATNLNTRQIFEFSYQKTKDVPVAQAVRASMSVPLFFTAVEIAGQIFVDGGTVFDYPLVGFGQSEIGNTLGLAFAQSSVVATKDQEDQDFGYHQPLQYIQRLVNVLQRVQSPVFALHDELQENTILIDTAGVNSLNFKVTKEEKERLAANGRQAVRQYFEGSKQ
jgi:NTE family protein